MQGKYILLLGLAAVMLLQSSPIPLRVVRLEGEAFISTPIPVAAAPLDSRMYADLTGDGKPESVMITDTGRAVILQGGGMAWESPAGWQVIQAEMTDLTRDGVPEAALLVWRPFRPWPVDAWLPAGGRIAGFHDSRGFSCQIILIGWQRGAFGEVWAGSALAEPVRQFAAVDLNGDGFQELVTLDGVYSEAASASARLLKAWKWDGFGFSNIARTEGVFTKMVILEEKDGRNVILLP